MNPLSVAIVQSGLVDRDMVKEIASWGMPVELPEAMPPAPKNLSELTELLERALQNEGLVVVRETDMEVLQLYMSTHKRGILHVVTQDGEADVPVTYAKNNRQEFIIPFTSESIAMEMTNGETYLVPEDPDGLFKVYFSDVRELFFGTVKAFMVCLSSQIEKMQVVHVEEDSDAQHLP